ncbi:MAG: 30S ribosomal protein S21 [Patescibacteria group bacterium]
MQTRRRDGESPEVKIRKFFREVQQSGILSEVKGRKEFTKDTSRRLRRKTAVRKAFIKKIKRGY